MGVTRGEREGIWGVCIYEMLYKGPHMYMMTSYLRKEGAFRLAGIGLRLSQNCSSVVWAPNKRPRVFGVLEFSMMVVLGG